MKIRLLPRLKIRGKAALSAVLLFALPAISYAAPPENPQLQGVPAQLALIRATLKDMQDQLDTIQAGLDQANAALREHDRKVIARFNAVDTAIEDVYLSVNSVDLTTQLCFKTGLDRVEGITGHGEFGVGWPNVLDAKLNLAYDGNLAFGLGLGNDVCIEIPLYSVFVEQDDSWLLPEVKTQLDDLITTLTLGAQKVVPIVGTVYAITLPSASSVIGVLEDVLAAANPLNPGYDPLKLLDINTYKPLTPPLLDEAIAAAPIIALEAITYPCEALAASPLGAGIPPATYDWMCAAPASFVFDVLKIVQDIANFLGI